MWNWDLLFLNLGSCKFPFKYCCSCSCEFWLLCPPYFDFHSEFGCLGVCCLISTYFWIPKLCLSERASFCYWFLISIVVREPTFVWFEFFFMQWGLFHSLKCGSFWRRFHIYREESLIFFVSWGFLWMSLGL